MGITKCIEYRGDRVRKYCGLIEQVGIEYISDLAENNIFIPIISFDFTKDYGWYETPRGEPARYDDPELFHWLKKCYKELKRLDISHNDIMLQNIVILPGNDYRLIDFETVRPGGGSFHDWCKINQLMQRIALNCPPNSISCNKDVSQNSVSFFRQ
jgi:hypothetical protein